MSSNNTGTVLQVVNGVQKFVEAPRPKTPPRNCKFSDEDLACLGCGQKLGCIKPEHCYAVEGKSSLK